MLFMNQALAGDWRQVVGSQSAR